MSVEKLNPLGHQNSSRSCLRSFAMHGEQAAVNKVSLPCGGNPRFCSFQGQQPPDLSPKLLSARRYYRSLAHRTRQPVAADRQCITGQQLGRWRPLESLASELVGLVASVKETPVFCRYYPCHKRRVHASMHGCSYMGRFDAHERSLRHASEADGADLDLKIALNQGSFPDSCESRASVA